MQTHTVTHCTSLKIARVWDPSGDDVLGDLRFIVTGHTTLTSALKQGLAIALTLKLSLITPTLILNQYQPSTLSFSWPLQWWLRLVHLYQHRCSIFHFMFLLGSEVAISQSEAPRRAEIHERHLHCHVNIKRPPSVPSGVINPLVLSLKGLQNTHVMKVGWAQPQLLN